MIYIVTGKNNDLDFLKKQLTLKNKKKEDIKIIGVDSGIDALVELKITPDFVVGDFDSLSDRGKYAIGLLDKKDVRSSSKGEIQDKEINLFSFNLFDYQIKKLNPIKDDTDTESAVKHVIKYMKGDMIVLGATSGHRLDHLLGNLNLLAYGLEHGRNITLLDPYNRIRICSDNMTLEKKDAYGKYLSIVPFYNNIENITLSGFKYNVENSAIRKDNTLGISNEIIEETACIQCQGVYLLIESKD